MKRVLVIGLDSADSELVAEWSREGRLPTLQALRRRGAWADLRTTAEVMHVSAWPSIYTGATPGHHGLYHAYQVRAGSQAVHRTRPEWCALPPLWKLLDDAGRRCLVMDAFMDPPATLHRGTHIREYGTWTWFSQPGARPRRVGRELLRRYGRYPAPEHTKVLTVPEPIRFRDQLTAGARRKGEIVRWLLGEVEWDLAFIGFAEPHGGGHYLWHHSDPEYPVHPPPGSGAEHPLRDVYAAVDEAIGCILDGVDASTTVLVTSGDGMGPNYSGCHLVPEVLHRLGLFHGDGVGSSPVASADRHSVRRRSSVAMLRQAIPLGIRQTISSCMPRSIHYRLSMKWVNEAIDWERSRAFCIPNSNEAYVRVNLEGREPRGTVSAGAAYSDLLAEVEARVSELVEPEGGLAAAEHIFKIDDVYQGSERRHLPDLVVTWDPEARVLDEVQSDACGRVRGRAGYQLAPYYTGNHRPRAFLVAAGGRVVPGSTLSGGHVLDLAPTVFALLGAAPPAHFEGRALSGLLGR